MKTTKLMATLLLGTSIITSAFLSAPAEARRNRHQEQLNALAMQMYMHNLAVQQGQQAQQAAAQQYQQQLAIQQYQMQLAQQAAMQPCQQQRVLQQFQCGDRPRFGGLRNRMRYMLSGF